MREEDDEEEGGEEEEQGAVELVVDRHACFGLWCLLMRDGRVRAGREVKATRTTGRQRRQRSKAVLHAAWIERLCGCGSWWERVRSV